MQKKNVGILVVLTMALGATLAQAGDSASSAQASISLGTFTSGPISWSTFGYCNEKSHLSRAKDARDAFRRYVACMVGSVPDWGKGTTEGVKWTGKHLVSIPNATQGSSEGTTEGLSGKEQEALIMAVQEDLMGVVGGAEPNALSEVFMQMKQESLETELSVEQLAAETLRDLEVIRAELN